MLENVPTNIFLKKYVSSNPMIQKSAQQLLDDYVRIKILEGGVVRSQIVPCIPITAKDLDKDEDPTVNKKFIPIEPDSEGATWVPYRANPPQTIIKTLRVPAYFGEIASPKQVINIYEHLTDEMDVRKMYQDRAIKYIQEEEDSKFIVKTIDPICAANPAQQLKRYSGGLTRINLLSAIQDFKSLPYKIPLACALMNDWTYTELQKWPMVDLPYQGTQQQEIVNEGKVGQLSGIKIITTIKSNIVPNRVVYLFSKPEFMGKFYELQAPTTMIKQEGNQIEFWTQEVVGFAIPNIRSFVKCIFDP